MIRGKFVNLRLFTEEDLKIYEQHVNDIAEIGEFWPLALASEKDLKDYWKESGFWGPKSGKILITDKHNKILGNINYFKGIPYVDGFELGYRIFRPEDRGKGYTSEAVRLFCSYLFSARPINRIQACADVNNIGSIKVMEKCGFKKEGTMRKAMFNRGEYRDVVIYSLLRDECPLLEEITQMR